MPEKMLKMQAYMTVLRFMEDRVKPNSEKAKLATWGVAGCAAGMATTIIGCPAELLMVQVSLLLSMPSGTCSLHAPLSASGRNRNEPCIITLCDPMLELCISLASKVSL